MAGVEDRMAKIKEIQEQAALKKKEAAEAAAKEKAEALESKTGERTLVEGELGNVGEELTKIESALAEVNAIDLGELDADSQDAVKAEVAGIQAEAEALKVKMAELAERKTKLDTEIAAMGGGEAAAAEAPAEVPAEAAKEGELTMTPEEQQELSKMEADIARISKEADGERDEKRRIEKELEDEFLGGDYFDFEDGLMEELTPEQQAVAKSLTDIDDLRQRKEVVLSQLKPSILPGRNPKLKSFIKVWKSPKFDQMADADDRLNKSDKEYMALRYSGKYDELRNKADRIQASKERVDKGLAA